MTREADAMVRVSTLLSAARNAGGSVKESVLREKLRRCFELQKRAFPFEMSIRLMTSRHLDDSELEEELLPPKCAEIMSRWLYGNEPDFSIDAVPNIQETIGLLRAMHDTLDDRLFTFFKGSEFANLSNRERYLINDQVTTTAMAKYLTDVSLAELSKLSMRWAEHRVATKQPSVLESLGLTTMLDLTADELVRLDLVNRLKNEQVEKVNSLWSLMQNDEVGSRLTHAYQLASQGYVPEASSLTRRRRIICGISSVSGRD
jgi:hypothetical protein